MYRLQLIYLQEKAEITAKHSKEAQYLQRKIQMTSEGIQLNDRHMKDLRPQDVLDMQDEI